MEPVMRTNVNFQIETVPAEVQPPGCTGTM
jgi:hypothetical protein